MYQNERWDGSDLSPQTTMESKWPEEAPTAPEKNYRTINSREQQSVEEPTDKRNIVRITMYLIGITCLLPWNFFIQANDYWMYKFRNTSVEDPSSVETELQATFPSYLAISSKVPYVLFLFVNTLIANRFRSTSRFQIPLLVMILLFVITIILVPVNTDYHQTAFFSATICLVIAINVMCGFLQGAGTGIAGSFPKEFMGYNVNGMAIGGIIASFAQIISLAGDTTPIQSAIIYFVLAIFILCLTFMVFRIAVKALTFKVEIWLRIKNPIILNGCHNQRKRDSRTVPRHLEANEDARFESSFALV